MNAKQEAIISALENNLDTRDKRFMFLKLEFPNLVNMVNLEGSTNDTCTNLYFEFEKHGENMIYNLICILNCKFNCRL